MGHPPRTQLAHRPSCGLKESPTFALGTRVTSSIAPGLLKRPARSVDTRTGIGKAVPTGARGARAILKDRQRLAKNKKKRQARKASKKKKKGKDSSGRYKSYSSSDMSSSSSDSSSDSSDLGARPRPSKPCVLAAKYNKTFQAAMCPQAQTLHERGGQSHTHAGQTLPQATGPLPPTPTSPPGSAPVPQTIPDTENGETPTGLSHLLQFVLWQMKGWTSGRPMRSHSQTQCAGSRGPRATEGYAAALSRLARILQRQHGATARESLCRTTFSNP